MAGKQFFLMNRIKASVLSMQPWAAATARVGLFADKHKHTFMSIIVPLSHPPRLLYTQGWQLLRLKKFCLIYKVVGAYPFMAY